jgi:hypothetical protein
MVSRDEQNFPPYLCWLHDSSHVPSRMAGPYCATVCSPVHLSKSSRGNRGTLGGEGLNGVRVRFLLLFDDRSFRGLPGGPSPFLG